MKTAEYALQHKTFIVFLMLSILAGGFYSYIRLGKLEDPEFTVKTAIIVTPYPGATPHEVEQQVTDVLEEYLQKTPKLDNLRSISRNNVSYIYVELQEHIFQDEVEQLWDIMRRRVYDAQQSLPPGAGPSIIQDDFGDVFGQFYALYGERFTPAELKDYARRLEKEILLVEGVSRVELFGIQEEQILLEIDQPVMASLGIHPGQIQELLLQQNVMTDAGSWETGRNRLRIHPTGVFKSVDDIAGLLIYSPVDGEMIKLRDILTIRRTYREPFREKMRYRGEPAVGILVSAESGTNVIQMSHRLDNTLQEVLGILPAGLQLSNVYHQGEVVRGSIQTFVINLVQSVSIVIGVLLLTMGLRSGLLIGSGLVLSILGTFIVMLLWGIDLQRTSLGALIVTMGMLVDNSIVVTDGILVQLEQGVKRSRAMIQPAIMTAMPLLGATIIAICAFLPIYLSPTMTGEYTRSLFQVVAAALLISWLLSMTQTPVMGSFLLRTPQNTQQNSPHSGKIYNIYSALLGKALQHRFITITALTLLLSLSIFGFQFIRVSFFPDSDKTLFLIDFWLEEGARIEAVSNDIKDLEKYLEKQPTVASYTTSIGTSPPRYYLPLEPELPNPSFGQIIVQMTSLDELENFIPDLQGYLDVHFVQAEPRIRRLVMGPNTPFKVEARFSGDDPELLRTLARQGKKIMEEHPHTKDVRDNWRQKVPVWETELSDFHARRSLVSRPDIIFSLKVSAEGVPLGYYRDDNDLLPMVLRFSEKDRFMLDNIHGIPVWGKGLESIPLSTLLHDSHLKWEDPMIHRHNRKRAITVQCDPVGMGSIDLTEELIPAFETIPLPPGYTLEWAGDYDLQQTSSRSIIEYLPISLVIMALIILALFNSIPKLMIIFLLIPFATVGVTIGLLVTGSEFGFMALVGMVSLSGMLIKNGVVLIDSIDHELKLNNLPYEALIKASKSRLRPVTMASFTTILGMIPLIGDVLFVHMAYTIMFGLAFAALLTLFIVPVLYSLFYRIPLPAEDNPDTSHNKG